jgi:hypothetical protein
MQMRLAATLPLYEQLRAVQARAARARRLRRLIGTVTARTCPYVRRVHEFAKTGLLSLCL